jgi:superfamily II DNA or RNA helicase
MHSGIKDNHSRGKAYDFLNSRLKERSSIRIVSAYFSMYAYHALKAPLNGLEGMKFLFGEPHLSPESLGSDSSAFSVSADGSGHTLSLGLKNRFVARECAEWLENIAAIRSVRERLVHGKLYHVDDGSRDHAMLGSSNFTLNGLGISGNSNIELNLVVDSDRDRNDLKVWFDELWSDDQLTHDVKQQIISALKAIFQNHTPEEIYFKTLSEIFAQLDADEDGTRLLDDAAVTTSQIWSMLFDFQKDGAKAAVQKLDRFGGCVIADSVGLGKTFTALAVIKYYESKNKSVLVLCPKKLRDNWTVYRSDNNSDLNPFLRDKFGYTVLSHTDLSRDSGHVGNIDLSRISWGNYDLVVIDESHNFRNNSKGKRDEDGNLIRKSRYERLMTDIIQAGAKTRVLLLSATPVNNDLKDLRNQLYFITENRDGAFLETLGIGNLKDLLSNSQKVFADWAKRSKERDVSRLMERLPSGLFKLLDGLSIARSRKHIQRYYSDSLEQIGQFPKRAKPISVYPQIDMKDQFLSYDRLNEQIGKYQLVVFNPARFLKKEFAHHYDDSVVRNFTQADREMFLIGMMKVNFLKRLESSIHSFTITIDRTIERIEALERRLLDYRKAQKDGEVDIAEYQDSLDLFEDDDPNPSEVGGAKKFSLDHLKVDDWLAMLKEDRVKLNEIRLHAKDVGPERDAKLQQLKALIAEKMANPSVNHDGNPVRKVIVFTAFADTASYLYEQIEDWAQKEFGAHSGLVTGSASGCRANFGRARFDEILVNFSPLAKKREGMRGMPKDGQIDILIATDCISEGQNLQDCDLLINYDIHWNPVRIIQRFGRIDRIGSRHNEIQLVNFWPTDDLNKYINLKGRVEARMALVDLSATSDDNILDVAGLEDLINEDMRYRDKQLLRLKDEVVDLEEFTESVVLSNFTLEDFRRELSNHNKQRREPELPNGVFGMVPPHPDHATITPGVIYCLRDRRDRPDGDTINPLQPFYLVYVRDSGEVAYGFAQAKQILDVYRVLCLGQKEAYNDLYAMFDNETDGGQNMAGYEALIGKAVDGITSQFSSRNIGNMLTDRGGKLAIEPDADTADTDFELVTWLIIKEGEDYRNV